MPSVDRDAGVLDDLGPLYQIGLQDSQELFGRGDEGLCALCGEEIDHLPGAEDASNVSIDLAHDRHVGSNRRQNSPPGIDVEARQPLLGNRRNLRCRCDTPRAADGKRADISSPDHLQHGWNAGERRVDLSADDIGNGGSHAAVGNVQHADSGIGLEHLTEQVMTEPLPEDA